MNHLTKEAKALADALEICVGAMRNDLHAQNLPDEWSPNSGIGIGTQALEKWAEFTGGE